MGDSASTRKLTSEIVRWVLPTVACVALAVRIAVLNPDPTALTNIVVWVVTSGIAVMAILMSRFGVVESNPQVGRWTVLISTVTTLVLVVQAFIWPYPWSRDKPSLYFAGAMRIGVSGDIPGWVGFDDRLIEWIGRRYGKGPDELEQIRLFQSQREEALEEGRVDLVISSYTATSLRAQRVDFAGPYFLDTTGVWGNAAKFKDGVWFSPDGKKANPTVCGVMGTTGTSPMASFLATQDPGNGGAIAAGGDYNNTADCLKDLIDMSSEVAYAATDWTSLKAYAPGVQAFDANRTHPHIDKHDGVVEKGDPGLAGWDTVDSPQYYGVAIRNGHPVTCKDLTAAIQEFVDQTKDLKSGYSSAYAEHLAARLGPVADDWHRPNFEALQWGQTGSPICR